MQEQCVQVKVDLNYLDCQQNKISFREDTFNQNHRVCGATNGAFRTKVHLQVLKCLGQRENQASGDTLSIF